jgi:RimJ/RimL family protein N-acetyltransferase
MKVLTSQRLCYQLMNEGDIDDLFKLDQNPKVMRYLNGGKATSMADIVNIALPRMLSYTNEQQGWGLWKVTVAASHTFIGWVLVRPMGFFSEQVELSNLELGWRFIESSWGKGYASEAAMAVKNALIENTQVTKFTAEALADNNGSIQVMKKIGMSYLSSSVHEPLNNAKTVTYQLLV